MRLSRKAIASIGAATAIGVGGVAVAVPAIASTTGSSTSSSPTATTAKKHPRGDHLRQHELKVAAATIGISPKALREQLRAGKSLKEVAAAHGVSEDKLVAALEKGLDPYVKKLVEHKRGAKKAGSRAGASPSATS